MWALKKAQKELKPRRARILTWGYRGKIDWVEAQPLWYWLLI